MSLTEFDKKFLGKVIGVDEVGRGCLAGPVVACATIIKDYEILPELLNDSKKISPINRQKIYDKLIENCYYSLSVIDNVKIDEINILQASLLAMKESIKALEFHKADHVIIDGAFLPETEIQYHYHGIIRGDNLSAAIAASSIIAKITRDNIMKKLSLIYPEYDWRQNMGYGTKKHIESIKKFGITEYHRKSFSPCRENN